VTQGFLVCSWNTKVHF